MDDTESLQGKLLVAAPSLLDPNFARTVVLLLAHGEHGALGLVLNRPTVTSLSSPLPEWAELALDACSHVCRRPGERGDDMPGQGQVGGLGPRLGLLGAARDLGTVDLETDPAFVAPWIEQLAHFRRLRRVGAGPARGGDGSRRLVGHRVPARKTCSAPTRELWKRVLRRQGGVLAMAAAFAARSLAQLDGHTGPVPASFGAIAVLSAYFRPRSGTRAPRNRYWTERAGEVRPPPEQAELPVREASLVPARARTEPGRTGAEPCAAGRLGGDLHALVLAYELERLLERQLQGGDQADRSRRTWPSACW